MARRQRFNYMEPIKPEWCEADNKYIYANKVEAERAPGAHSRNEGTKCGCIKATRAGIGI